MILPGLKKSRWWSLSITITIIIITITITTTIITIIITTTITITIITTTRKMLAEVVLRLIEPVCLPSRQRPRHTGRWIRLGFLGASPFRYENPAFEPLD
ncbi:MAG TPA: hypothetical protein VFE60_16205 [Roseiarcus sp.]|jgi:hypothetical protein|nr:hypothetical protein [Roseiarcus sp.]